MLDLKDDKLQDSRKVVDHNDSHSREDLGMKDDL